MHWDEDPPHKSLPIRGRRPTAETIIIPPGRRFRHPAAQAEIQRRVAIYTQQVEQTGQITYLPYRGSGL
jgi:hypothetical protein